MRWRFATLLLCALALPLRATAELPVIHVITEDRELARAFAEARATLPTAIAATEKRNGRFSPSLALRVAVPVADPEVRLALVWVDGIRREGDAFTGRLAGRSRHLALPLRSLIRFNYTQIGDWAVQAEDGRYYGYYTTRAVLGTLDPAAAARVRAILVPRPLPPLWRDAPSEPRPPGAEPDDPPDDPLADPSLREIGLD